MILGLVGAVILVLANGFFVASEFAIARARATQVAELQAERRPGARALHHAVEHIDSYLAACQLGITISSIGLGFVAKPAFEELLAPMFGGDSDAAYAFSFAFAFGIVTLLHVVVGELAPKSLAISRTIPTGLAIATPMRLFYLATKPLVDFFNWLGNLLLRPFGIPPAREAAHAAHSLDELHILLRESSDQGMIEQAEQELASNILVYGELRARQIMVPRAAIDFVTTANSLEGAARRAIASGHTRLPLCDPELGLDKPIGVINVKDVIRAMLDEPEAELTTLARPVERVSESVRIDELLRELLPERQHIALVIDEYGTTTGLITLEDILEEIVGEIDDEFDLRPDSLITRVDGRLVVHGSAPVHLVAEEIGIKFDDAHEATIGGYLVERLGRIPEQGEQIELAGQRFEVIEIGDARILRLQVVGNTDGLLRSVEPG